jgi:hypothetical protein
MRRLVQRTRRWGVGILAALSLALPATADEYEVEWSASIGAVVKDFESPVDDDGVTGFFDQYEFTADKDRDLPVQLAIPELSLDVLGAEQTPALQFRFLSPTSNLGVTDLDDGNFFLNQRADLFARREGYAIDVDYRRMRTYELRLFPRPSDIGRDFASFFNDDTAPDDRFSTTRMGAGGAVRLRMAGLLGDASKPLVGMMPEFALRGRYEKRDGDRQFRYYLDDPIDSTSPTSSWRGLASERDQRLSTVGGGAVFTPGGWFTMVLDVDHERFRENAPAFQQSQITDPGVRNTSKTINFVPDTNRTTGSVRLQRRFGERAAFHGGFQSASLQQVDDLTPIQQATGLTDNAIRFYSADLAGDVVFTEAVSTNAYFKYDLRDNRIQRDTVLFNPDEGDPSQVAPFLETLEEIRAGAELEYRPRPTRVLALGYRGEWVDRDLDYASPTNSLGAPNEIILSSNAVVHPKTETHSVYLRGRARPARGLSFSGEVGYLNAPETGYSRELSEAVYFKFNGFYRVPIRIPLKLTLFGRGEFGENDQFNQNSETPGAPDPDRDFERNDYGYGITGTLRPHRQVTLFASFFQRRDSQDFQLVRSNLARTFEPSGASVNFFKNGPLDYRSDLTNVLFGGRYRITERTDVSLSYSYTHSDSRFSADEPTAETLEETSEILSDIHSIDANVGHWLRDGLRIYAGYRYDRYRDHAQVSSGAGIVPPPPVSAVPFDLSTQQHTFTAGITLNSDLFE